ncbi:MAG: glycosyltransferase family 2 protein [Verrucomicrobiales bacterium]|jgi:glycosyltransferase involved in cell wall biosynthesis|nr:glycosyltransferase family 2 protein [Verrucomicrobiales bacterium]
MIAGKKICVVMPAYNAGKTLAQTVAAIDRSVADEIIVVDDGSHDDTRAVARRLGIGYVFHKTNHGYGGNQKTCYAFALGVGADVVVMVHPDYQYEPRLLPALAGMVASGVYDVAIASRILGHGARKGRMPLYKYIANRALSWFQNFFLGLKLSEYHTGYRAFSRKVLETLPLLANSDDFVFDNQMLAQCRAWDFEIGEISCPTKYFPEASSINFSRSVKYGFGVLKVSLDYRLMALGLAKPDYLNRVNGGAGNPLTVSAATVGDRVLESNLSHAGIPAGMDKAARFLD